jgi:hypothetical protein
MSKPMSLIQTLVAVELGYPWQVGYTSLLRKEIDWQPAIFGDFYTLLATLSDKMPVRLQPDYVWDFPVENRVEFVCWARVRPKKTNEQWSPWRKEFKRPIGTLRVYDYQFVTPDPRNPDTPPPSDWTPEGRRVVK